MKSYVHPHMGFWRFNFKMPSTLFLKTSYFMSSEEINDFGRTCSKCGAQKAWDQFDKKSTGPNGRHSRCKTCIKTEKKKWWRRKNVRKVSCPEVLIYSKSDLETVEIPLAGQDRRDLENIFRRLIFQSIVSGKESKS